MAESGAAIDGVLGWLDTNEAQGVERLCDWLRIPSVSTDPAYASQCARAAEWAADQLRSIGFEAELRPTGGHPIVMAHSPGEPGYRGPHVLFYGHYDVQPADPLELWESPAFEPVVRDAREGEAGGRRIVARGAVDDKGQVSTFIEAMRAWKESSGLAGGGVRWTIMLEGEEESGSKNLEAFVREHKAELKKCDVCLISDTGMLGRNKPAITYGVRGLSYTEVVLHAANQDLHSGLWGGRCPNPITELTRVLAQLHDKKRRVTIPGFYDDVRPIKKSERAAWARLKFKQKAALRAIGLPPAADVGEAGFTAIEREWGRPTAELNGIVGGYIGAGAKTVIPSHASAKVSFRLVADQNPSKIAKAFFAWCKERTPPGCRWEFIDHGSGPGVTTPVDSDTMQCAQRAMKRASGKKPALIRSGGSIPVAGMLKDRLGLDTIFMGFGLDDDRVHSPNEKFEIDCWRLGARSHALLVDELRGVGGL
ncbi:MAG: M20/M25/M40 family metallo-hydrolase [Phycisphaerales bacterium]|jgi:acetylornithine deacetylase/succinyl-diaminopimelate desuccinylase-like protein|nr:M20/M25/M40 family metallo-hydrolase [Phycisphaerales bacterium]